MKCIVCKQLIKDGETTIKTEQGIVHTGQCEQYLSEKVMSESSDDIGTVELLM